MVTSPWRTWPSASVLRPSEASYDAYLQRHGYSPAITRAYRHAVGHFAHWLTEEHLALRGLDESVVRRFVTTHLPACRCPGHGRRRPGCPGTSAAGVTGRWSDPGTPRRAVARDARRIGMLHQLSGAGLQIGGQDPRRPSVVGRTVPGGSLRSRASRHRSPHPGRHRGFPRATRDALHARAPQASAPALSAAICVSAPPGTPMAWTP